MDLNNFKTLATGLKTTVLRNSPTILTAFGVGGTIATAILAGQGAVKAYRILAEEDAIRMAEWSKTTGEHETAIPVHVYEQPKEVLKLTWQCYIPAVATGLVTITAIVGSNRISIKRQAAMTALYALAEGAAKKYEDKVVELLGSRKAENIKEEIAQDLVNERPMSQSTVVNTGKGETLFFDMMSGRYFKSDLETVRKTVNDFNRDIILDGFMTLNSFYADLGLEPVKMGEMMGWGTDYGFLEIIYRTKISDNGQPCIVLDYKVEPRTY